MRYGLYLPTEGEFADVRLLAALARDAEEAGWDGVFIWDELLSIFEHSGPIRAALGEAGDVADAFVALTAIAAATTRIRFGAMVTPVARLRPELFARQTATLDRYSGGRLVIGVGLGSPDLHFSAFGLEAGTRVRAEMVDEFLDLLTQLWTGDEVNFTGSHYRAAGVVMSPTPLQQPRIPIWVGADARYRAPRRRAARWDGFVPVSDSWPDGVISADHYRTAVAEIAASRQPHKPFDVVVVGNAAGTLPSNDTLESYAAAGVTWLFIQALTVKDTRDRIFRGPPQPNR